jgi:hypothetical protein
VARPGQRRVLARRVRRLLSPAPAPGGEERAARAEAQLAAGAAVDVTVADVNGDGREEILVRTPALSVTLNPARGGTLTEIGALARRHDAPTCSPARPRPITRGSRGPGRGRSIGDTTPEKEPGLHRLLTYDRFRRASLLDGLFDADGDLDPWSRGLRAGWRSATRASSTTCSGRGRRRDLLCAIDPSIRGSPRWTSV